MAERENTVPVTYMPSTPKWENTVLQHHAIFKINMHL
jgi:hypothetical protein